MRTGERLTASAARKPGDFFHSRLACSPDGTMLADAGWLRHPVDEVRADDIEAALSDPTVLDTGSMGHNAWADQSCACSTCGTALPHPGSSSTPGPAR
jgi:hypothetical protein